MAEHTVPQSPFPFPAFGPGGSAGTDAIIERNRDRRAIVLFRCQFWSGRMRPDWDGWTNRLFVEACLSQIVVYD